MRTLPVLVSIAIALALVPLASAGAFDLGSGKIVERGLALGEDVTFEMPLTFNQDGFLYAKVLPTPGNAVNDGTTINGSVADGTGWRVSFAAIQPNGDRHEMGTFVDSTESDFVPVLNGDELTFIATVHIPESAKDGGPRQRVYVAVAYRFGEAGSDPGAASGARIDEARALTLLMTNDLLPPVEIKTPPPEESTPEESVPPVEPVEPLPSNSSGVQVVIVRDAMPWWFLGIVVVSLAAIVSTLGVIALVLYNMNRDVRLVGVARRAQSDAEEVPAETYAARELLSMLRDSQARRIPVESGPKETPAPTEEQAPKE